MKTKSLVYKAADIFSIRKRAERAGKHPSPRAWAKTIGHLIKKATPRRRLLGEQ